MSQTPRTDAGTITIKVGAETWVVCRLDVAAEMERELAAARAENEALRKRIRDDAMAMSCQTLGQYRAALLARDQEPQP